MYFGPKIGYILYNLVRIEFITVTHKIYALDPGHDSKSRNSQIVIDINFMVGRTKLKQTGMECEYLKRCFGSLREENRRLQREIEELRALRATPLTVLLPETRQPMPASSMTMCPRCQRISTTSRSVELQHCKPAFL